MFFQDLEAAVSPTVPLLLVSFKAVRQQAAAITPVGIMSLPAEFEQRQSKVGVLADRIARPAARGFDCRASDETHRAVRDDCIKLVALDHADVKEAGIFAIHRIMHDAACAIAVILWCLHQPDSRIAEKRYE